MTTNTRTHLLALLLCAPVTSQQTIKQLVERLENPRSTDDSCKLIAKAPQFALRIRPALPILVKFLVQGSPDEREAAKKALIELAQHTSSIAPRLWRHSKSQDPAVRAAVQAVLDARRPKPPARADLDTLIREFEAGDPHYSQPATLKKIAALGESTPQLVQKLAILISDRAVGKEAARVLIGFEAAGYPAISKLVAHISAMPEPRLDETQASFLATRAKQAESAIPLLSKLSASARRTTARRAFVTLTAIAEFHPDAQAQVDELMRTSGVKAAMQAQPSAIRDAIVQAENGEPANLIACLNRAETADLALVELERFIARDLGVLYKVILTANDLEQVARLVISAGDEGVQALLLCLDARTAAIGKRAEALALVGAQTPWIRPLLEDYARHYLRAPLRPPFEHAISQTPIPSPEQLAATAELAQRVRIVWHIWALTLDHSHPMDAELVKTAINGTSQRERVRALWAVQRLDAAATKPFVPVIVRAAREYSWALDALLNVARKLGTPLAQLAPEIWAMRVSGTDAQRARIALTLAHEYPLTIARAGICYAALRDPQPKIRQAALTEAGKLPPRERLDLILSTGGIEDSSLRMRAADMFRGIPRELLIPRREEVDRWFDILRPHPVQRDPARALTARVYLHIGKTGFDRVETFLQEELQAERDTRDTKSRRPRNRRNLLRDIAELAVDGRPLAPTIFAFARSEDQATRKSAFRALAAMQLQDDPMLAAAWLGLVRTHLADQAQWDAYHTAAVLEVLPNLGHGAAFAIETVLTLKGVPAQEADPSHSKRFRALVALGATDAQITSYLKHVLGRMTQSNRLLATEICALGDRATMLFPLLKSSMQHKVWMRGWCAEILRELTPKLTVATAPAVPPFVLALLGDPTKPIAPVNHNICHAIGELPTLATPGIVVHLDAMNRATVNAPDSSFDVIHRMWNWIAPLLSRSQATAIVSILLDENSGRSTSPNAIGYTMGRLGPMGFDIFAEMFTGREISKGFIGGWTRAAPDLIWEQRARFPNHLSSIVEVLGSIPGEPWIHDVIESLLDHRDQRVRRAANDHLAILGRRALPHVRSLLVGGAPQNPFTRLRAIHGLGTEAVELMDELLLLHAKSPIERRSIQHLLVGMGRPGLLALSNLELTASEAQQAVNEALRGADDESYAWALKMIKDHKLPVPMNDFLPANENQRSLFINVIVQRKTVPRRLHTLLQREHFDLTTKQHIDLLRWLVRIETKTTPLPAVLTNALLAVDADLRIVAVQQLRGLGAIAVDAFAALEARCKDSDPRVRESAKALCSRLAPLHAARAELQRCLRAPNASSADIERAQRECERLIRAQSR